MFSTKKDIDRHVKTSLNKLPENERYLRGLAIARQYFKLNEYASAEHWLSCYLSVQEDSAPAHKLLGQCYEKQKKFDRAITSYQRSLQLDSKQTGLITDVCKLLLMDDNLTKHLSKAKHWCDLAESERINHEAVLNLKLKVANKDAGADSKLVKDIILKEVLARPLDPLLRVRLVDHLLEEKKLDEAFKYCFELEMKFCEPFMQSSEWTNGVANMLAKFAEAPVEGGKQKHWNYYLLQALVLDRQIYLNLLADSTMETIKRSNLKEIAQKLFKLDQTLLQVAEKGRNAAPQKQMADAYLRHYRGQLLLYSAALLFKAAQDQTGGAGGGGGRARDTSKKCLALLLMAYQCGVPDPDEPWLKQSSEMARHLVGFWSKQAAFRCCQAGSPLVSCVEDGPDVSVLAQIQSVTESKVWTTADDLVNQIRQLCSDPGWRQSVARALYTSGDLSSKATSSGYFVKDGVAFGEPQYVLPKREQLELYVELAQSLYPSSLPYLVYLGLVVGTENLSDFHCKAFPRLNFSTNNLNNSNLETLNQLDMDSFLYCCILIAQSNLDGNRQLSQQQGRPAFLPAANLMPLLCEDNKIDWWSVAYNLIKSSTAKEAAASVAEQRQLLEHGIQAIRGTDAPLCDVMVLLKLGQVLAKRAAASTLTKAEERRYVETRAEAVYRAGVLLWKMRAESSYGGGMDGGASTGYGSGLFFKYAAKSYDCQQELAKLAESAITFLAGVYFKHGRYEEFTQDFGGIPLPFAAYFRAEAFKKLDEENKTPLKSKKFYSERARECIRQTQRYLELPYVERNHPLNYVVQSEIKRLSFTNDSLDGSLNTSANGAIGASADDSDHFQSFTSSLTNPGMASGGGGGMSAALSRSISERDAASAAATAAASLCLSKTNDLEALMRQMMETLTFVKEDVLGIRNDVGDMQDRLVKIEENIYRKPTEAKEGAPNATATSTPMGVNDSASVSAAAAAAAVQAMNDMYMMDELQSSASALAYQHAAAAAAAAARAPVMGGVGMGTPQQPASALPYHTLYGANAYQSYMPGQIQQHQQQQQQHQQQHHQQQQMLTPRGHPMTGAMGASPMHSAAYQHHPDNLLVAAGGSPAAGGGYHMPGFQQAVPPPPVAPQPEPQVAPVMHSTPTAVSQMVAPAPKTAASANLSIEQSLQTPALLSSWNSTYNNSFMGQTSTPSVSNILPAHITSSVELKGGAPVNVVITSSDPLPPPPSVNSSTFAAGAAVQPTYSVTIPPQYIKHSNTGASIAQGTTGNSNAPKLEMVSPAANTKFPMPSIVSTGGLANSKPAAAAPAPATAPAAALTPSFFANMVSPAKMAAEANQADEEEDDDDKNVSGSAEYDPRPDFQPIIPLPDEIVVRTGEEDEEQIFTGRSKLLRLVDREWKERGLGELKILRSKADRSKYRIVMRREQVHKICANHYITPELIIKPMEKRKECYIWAAMDFADEEPRKESFCARFGTAALASEFYAAFVAARDEVARLRATSGDQQSSAAPPPATMGSFAYSSTPKSSAASSTPAAAAPVQSQATAKPFGEFSFAKNYTPPAVVGTKAGAKGPDSTPTSSTVQSGTDAKPSPFASFTFKAQTPGGSASSPFGNIFGGAGVVAGAPSLGFEERDFSCAHETNVVGLKRKEQQWIDCAVSNGQLRLLTSQSAVRLLMRNVANTTVYLNHVLTKEVQIKANDKTACSWTVQQDAAYPAVTGPISFMAQFKTADERDRFVAAVQKAFPGSTAGAAAAAAGGGAKTASGFGDLFKPKTGSWDCPGCYVNNKADSAQCVACNGPRDPSKKEEQKPSLSGGLFGNLAPPTEAASKFTFGMPSSSVTVTPITFGSVANTKKPLQEQPAKPALVTSTPVAKGASTGGGGGGFGDQFKPKPGSWTCNGCYLSNGADALYCMSCESPKDDTVPKKSAGGAAGGLLKGATDTAPKISFAAGGGFTFGLPSSTTITPATGPAMATGTVTTTTSATSLPAQQQQPVFGGGFSFGNPMKPPQSALSTVATAGTTAAAAAATTTTTLDKPAFKFELPTPSGGLSFGSKLTPNAPAAAKAAGDGPAVVASTPSSSAISKLEPPEKATFGFVFKPKSPGRTMSGDGDGAEDDGAAGDNSVTEEENNTYFAPVIPLPDKIDVKTGEEDEHVLYAHRAKLYRFVSSEWKERGIGDVKILKHKVTGNLRVVMRREQVLKICLNHALTEDICYTKKDDKSWQFVANDFSEGNFEIMNFCLRFKSSDIAQEFRDAITDALSGKLSAPVEAKEDGAPSTKVTSPAQNDITITSTSSPVGDLNFSKLSDISLNERETAQKLKLPDNFFDPAATPCAGCRGCDSDAFVFPAVDEKQLAVVEADDAPLPIDIRSVKPLPAAVANSSPKKVTFGTISAGTMQPPAQLFGGGGVAGKPFAASEPATGAGMFAGVAFKAPASSTTASSTTGSFLSAEQKASSSPFAASIFGGAQQPPSSTTVTDPAAASAGSNKFAFGSSTPLGSAATGGSIFSASLNTTPKTSFVSPAPTSTVTAVGTGAQVTSTTDSKKDGASTATTGSSPLLQPASLTTPPSAKSAESGGKLFSGFGGGAGFGSAGSTTNIFGGGNIFGSNATNSIAAATTASNSSNSTSTPTATAGGAANNTSTLFGSVAFGDPGKPSVFGGSGFTFGSLAKQSPAGGGANSSISTALKNNSDAPSIFKMDDSVSFATLASSNSPAFSSSTKQADDGTAKPAGGFVGLTVKEDFFSRSASAKLNSSTDGTNSSQTNNNGNADDGAGGEDGGGAAGGGDENYDPYYAPVIQLPDEIEVRTGEEEETKLFGERAKLYRFDATTKEWKERGVGELKILHHPVRNAYRLLLRREQIFKLVLNHAVTADLSIAPMNNSDKAFAWGAMNHAESPGQLEQLAVRFKNEAIASEFRSTLERCQEQLRSRPDLEPDQD